MNILIITSCTGEKLISHEKALTIEDFCLGKSHVKSRESELKEYLTSAEDMYTGQQHIRLRQGIKEYRNQKEDSGSIDIWILSAGYGIVPSSQKVAPYECTFQGMKKKELRDWADTLNVPADFRQVVGKTYDLCLVLLGDAYLEACAIDQKVSFASPTLLFCGTQTAKGLPHLNNLRVVTLSNPEAKRFSCGLIGLKGELTARLLKLLTKDSELIHNIFDPLCDVLLRLEGSNSEIKRTVKPSYISNPDIDRVITIPESWWQKPHRQKLRYFIPEWDDLVDRDYDFESDTHSGGTGDWSNEVYAHQLYAEPNYDGILISKVVAEKSKKKKERINQMGVHRYLRVPQEYPIMGDCGAFGYITQETPPYTTDEILDYYTRLGFNYGVSIDHLIVTATEAQKKFRYELTIHNAEEFIKEHMKRGLAWEPIGAVQGWDPKSYTEAARQYVAMGYKYIALGGLVRTTTPKIIQVLEEVHKVVPPNVKMHLLGIARPNALDEFVNFGVTSVDSASFLRRAWLGTGQNYLNDKGEFFSAIRIPEAEKSFRAKRMVSEGRSSAQKAIELERAAMKAMLDFDKGKITVDSVLNIIVDLDQLITPDRPDNTTLLRETLEAAPWKQCNCNICKKDGIQVIIFRGNNRNRRRGFHNTYVFYRILQRVLAGEKISITRHKKQDQSPLFDDLIEECI